MGTIIDLARTWLRPFVTDGVPASGNNDPDKAEGIAVFTEIDDEFGTIDDKFLAVDDQIDVLAEQVEAGSDPAFTFDASGKAGTTVTTFVPADPDRASLTVLNVGLTGGNITITTNGDDPVSGGAGTYPAGPGIGYDWSSLDAPKGAVKAIASVADTSLTVSYSSRKYNPPGLLRLLDAFVTPVSDARAILLRAQWKSLADANFDIAKMAHFMTLNPTEQASLINWPDGSQMVNHGATFLADRYFQGNATTAYIDTLVNLTSKGFSQNNAFMECWVLGTGTGFHTALGSGRASIQPNRTTTAFGVRSNTAAFTNHTTGVHVGGHFAWVRTSPSTYRAYYNGANVGGDTSVASDGSPVNSLYLLARNFGGISEPSDMQIIGSAAGSAPLGDPDAAIDALYSARSTYYTAIGAI